MIASFATSKGLDLADKKLNISGTMGTPKAQNAGCEDINGLSKPQQVHHFASNKNKTYTQQFKDITKKYGLDLNEEWNKELLPHQGRHPNAYHEFILDELTNIDNIANGDIDIFLELYESNIKKVIRENPNMLYKEYWINK